MSKRQRAGDGESASAHGQHTSAEANQTVVTLNPAFKQRFGPVGEALAQELTPFSLDVVGIVAAYAVCGVATADAKPQLLFSCGREIDDRGCFGIASSPDGNRIWVASHQKLSLFDGEGKHLMTMKSDALGEPRGIAFASDGRAFVCSFTKHCVAVCASASDCSVVRTIGSHTGDGHLSRPRGLALHGDLLFVLSAGHSRVEVFNKSSGAFVRSVGRIGDGDGQFDLPRDVVVSAAGEVFSVDGTFLRTFGRRGSGPGQFSTPVGLAIDRADNLLVCDKANGRVQVLTPRGSFITAIRTAWPHCVYVDREGRILVGSGRAGVHVFAFLA